MQRCATRSQSLTCAALAASFLVSAQSLAGTQTGVITYGPLSSAVPALGGAGLIVLSALLGLVSLRFLKDRNSGKFLTLAILTGAIAAGGSGVKLISDAHAAPIGLVALSNASGGSVAIEAEGYSNVRNTTGAAQKILSISVEPGCVLASDLNINGGNVVNGGNGGAFRGTCSDSPGTVLQPADFCEVNVCCSGLNGGCILPD